MLQNTQLIGKAPSAEWRAKAGVSSGPNASKPAPVKIEKKILNMKSKRKQNLVKKAHELARLAKLQITIIIFDKDHNCLQEFNTDQQFDAEAACLFQQTNQMLLLDKSRYRDINRKQIPQWNYIEKTSTADFLKGYKQYQHVVIGEIQSNIQTQKFVPQIF